MNKDDFELLAKHIPPGVSYSYSGGDTVFREENGVITEIPVNDDDPKETPNAE